ncbi:MAG: 3-deoxy-manno-octulosonate cytidylyltransferase [Paracoccaceae bacterium]|nr:3-deoxy-manno-octulosonate cytidylyltransferase [Paracoccaceae bacterium]
MKTIIIIPARYASTRYPGKPLAMLRLPDGQNKSLIQLSYETACKANGIDSVYVATDDTRIQSAAHAFGAQVIMTSSDCSNGTARCADAMMRAKLEADLFINLQGDAPLTPEWFVEDLMDEMRQNKIVQMATPVLKVDPHTYGHFKDDRSHGRVGGTTAVFDKFGHALYFSKEVLPFINEENLLDPKDIPVYHHVGIYAYRPEALRAYTNWPEGPLEKLEGLEQLRFLENGQKVKCVEVDGKGRVFWELNNPEDVKRIEQVLGN